MSYDIDYRVPVCPHCGEQPEPDGLSPTFNVARIFRACLNRGKLANGREFAGQVRHGIHTLHGMTGKEAAPIIDDALSWLGDAQSVEMLEPLQPKNGCGDTGTVMSALYKMRVWCDRWPNGVIDTAYGEGLK